MEKFIRTNKKIFYLIGFYLIAIIVVSYFWPQEIDWTPSFSKYHSKPYGTEILNDQMSHIFPNSKISLSQQSIYNSLDTIYQKGSGTYFFANTSVHFDSLELSSLLRYVDDGNDAFITARNFSKKLLDTLSVKLKRVSELDLLYNSDTIAYHFYADKFLDQTYVFSQISDHSYFEIDSSANVMATSYLDSLDHYNQINIPYGKGKFILNTQPFAFTNYFVLDDDARMYSSNCLSYITKNDYIIWDEYYKVGRKRVSKSPFGELLKITPLKWAFWISFFSILLFILFHAKRKQRIIPIVEPYKNTSTLFAKNIGTLYFEKSSYLDIARKKVTFFKSFLHRNYLLSNISFNETDAQLIHAKTGYPISDLHNLFDMINQMNNIGVNSTSFQSLIKGINHFYNHT